MLYSDELKSCDEDERKLYDLYFQKDALENEIKQIEQQQSLTVQQQNNVNTQYYQFTTVDELVAYKILEEKSLQDLWDNLET